MAVDDDGGTFDEILTGVGFGVGIDGFLLVEHELFKGLIDEWGFMFGCD